MAKVVLITGSTDGLGRQAALELGKRPEYHVILHGRSEKRCKEALAWLQGQLGKTRSFDYVIGDFGRLASVAEMAADVEKRFPSLNVLLCNAGVLNPARETTPDGLEATFQINHLAHFLLVNKLRGLLERNAPSRVILVSSLTHSWQAILWDDLQAEKSYGKYVQYPQSKLMNHLVAFALHRRLKEAKSGLASLVMEPGVITTKLLGNTEFAGFPIEQGPRTEVFCVEDEGVKSGAYYDCGTRELKRIGRPITKRTRRGSGPCPPRCLQIWGSLCDDHLTYLVMEHLLDYDKKSRVSRSSRCWVLFATPQFRHWLLA